MNLLILLLLIAEICLGICAWLSPHLLRWLAAHLLTRADVIDASRKESARRLQFWSGELGLSSEQPEESEASLPQLSGFARQ
jgi:hypothetical protein